MFESKRKKMTKNWFKNDPKFDLKSRRLEKFKKRKAEQCNKKLKKNHQQTNKQTRNFCCA